MSQCGHNQVLPYEYEPIFMGGNGFMRKATGSMRLTKYICTCCGGVFDAPKAEESQ